MLNKNMSKKNNNQKNFFVDFWDGKLSLPMSYWGVGVLGSIIYALVVGFFVGLIGLGGDTVWGFIIPFQVYIVVGIWRASNNYKGNKAWAVLAKVFVVIGIISNLSQLLNGY
jgi:hypothetical protein